MSATTDTTSSSGSTAVPAPRSSASSRGQGGDGDRAGDGRSPHRSRPPARALSIGVVTLWLSVLVLLPLAALAVTSFEGGFEQFWEAVTAPTAVAALRVTVGISAVVALLNAVMGTLIAWVLVRDDFPGKGLVNAMIDLPFALPTIVASIVLLLLYGPSSPVNIHLNATRWGVGLALAFVTLPFVVRAVQPVLIEADRDAEEAAASLGANNRIIFRRIVLPALAPAIFSGTGLAFARAVGEYGSVVLIGGNIPRETQVVSQYIQQQIEVGRPENAAAISVVLLLIAFVVLAVLRAVSMIGHRRMEASR